MNVDSNLMEGVTNFSLAKGWEGWINPLDLYDSIAQ